MGYGDLGCYGGKIPTPNIDTLARRGLCFTDAHSSSAVCTPSRYSLLTGRYAWRSRLKWGVIDGYTQPLIDPARTTIASFLKAQGYRTGVFGKWHLGLDFAQSRRSPLLPGGILDPGAVDYTRPIQGGPLDVGFDRYFGMAASLNQPPWCFIDNDRTVGIPSIERERTPEFVEGMPAGLMVPDWNDEIADLRFAEEAERFIHECTRHIGEGAPDRAPDRAAAVTGDGSRGDARDHTGGPFFTYLALSAPHTPWFPPEETRGSSGIGPRGDLIVLVDLIVGRVVSLLEQLGVADETLVIVTSDNGGHDCAGFEQEAFGHAVNGELRGFKSQIFDGGHRVPLVIAGPDVAPAAGTCRDCICLMDLFATVADIISVPVPAGTAEDALSFYPSLGDNRSTPARYSLIHHSGRGRFAIRKGDWKLIDSVDSGALGIREWRSPGPGEPEGMLFRIGSDVSERTNLWNSESQRVDELLSELVDAQDK